MSGIVIGAQDLRAARQRHAHPGVIVAARLDGVGVALAWLLRRSPNIVPIPGTSSVAHLHANLAAASLTLPGNAVATLDAIGR